MKDIKGMRVGISCALFFFVSVLQAAVEPPNGDCWRYWLSQGFASSSDNGRPTYLFEPGSKESYSQFYERIERDQCVKEWVFVIYMAADNDLSPYAFRDIWEMEAEGSAPSTDVIVFLDDAQTQATRYLHISKRSQPFDYTEKLSAFQKQHASEFQSDKEIEEAFLKKFGPLSFKEVPLDGTLIQSPVVVQRAESDSGDIKTAGRFLQWVMRKYPARRVALLGWSHGEGFDAPERQTNQQGRQGGFAFDFQSGSHMRVTEMATGLKAILDKYREGQGIDILGSDACLNQQIEFGYEWEGLADFLFGSSSIVQHKGFNYRSFLELFNDSPLKTTEYFATQIPKIYGNSVSFGSGHIYGSYFDPDATMTSFYVHELNPIVDKLEVLGARLLAWVKGGDHPIEQLVRSQKIVKSVRDLNRLGGVSVDLLALMRLFQAGTFSREVASVATELETLIDHAVVSTFLGKNIEHESAGVGIWVPISNVEYQKMYPRFLKSRVYKKAPAWAKFIRTLFEI